MTMKERRAAAVADGYCASCMRRRPTGTLRTCDHYIGLNNDRRPGSGAASHICCQSHGTHRFDCPESPVRGHGPYLRRAA